MCVCFSISVYSVCARGQRASMCRGVCKFSIIKDKELAGNVGLTPS